MKRITKTALLLLVIGLVPAVVLSAQEDLIDFAEYEAGIEQFATDMASTLPLNAAIGLAWSDAYIGQFPHFGVGLSLGGSTIPYDTAKFVLTPLKLVDDIEGNPTFEYIAKIGMPIPAYALEARIGGLLIPFDAGVKFGFIPTNFEPGDWLPGLSIDYTLAGFDVRFPIVQERTLLPEISVGGGYNYLRASIGIDGIYSENITLDGFEVAGEPVPIIMEPPSVEFNWAANIIDLKAQVSKNVLFFRPFVGVGAALGFGRAGGGFDTNILSPTPEEIDEYREILAQLDPDATLPDLSTDGFYLSAPMTADWSFRGYAGVGLNILVVKLDLMGMYDFLAGNFGATIGLRVQL